MATSTTPAAAATTVAPPRAKINISLKKKTKSSKRSNPIQLHDKKTLLGEEYSTIAEEAEVISQRRREEGTLLVIPCSQGQSNAKEGKDEGKKKEQPLLAGRLALLRSGGDDDAGGMTVEQSNKEDGIAPDNANATNAHTNNVSNNDEILGDEEAAVQQLIQSAHAQNEKGSDQITHHGVGGTGLVIAAPSQNNLNTTTTTTRLTIATKKSNGTVSMNKMNDEEIFQRELAHHAADLDPTSNAYASVAIRDFGSALLRGMGWTGGATDKPSNASSSGSRLGNGSAGNKPGAEEETIKPRPHRLGLGAKPLLPPTSINRPSSRGGGSGGIHRRARRPDEVKRDEERQKMQEEAEKRASEKKRLDVQFTLQKGSVVSIVGGKGKRALIIKTAGVPGLNRILIQFEGSSQATSVAKHSIALCSWEDLNENPFQKIDLRQSEKKERQPTKELANESFADRKRVRSHHEDDRGEDDRQARKRSYSDEDCGYDSRQRRRGREGHLVHDDDDDSRDDDSRRRRRSKEHKRKKRSRRHHGGDHRSRSRSDSRDRRKGRSDSRERHRKRSRSNSNERGSYRRSRKESSSRRREDRSRNRLDEDDGYSRKSCEKQRSKHQHSSSGTHNSQSTQQQHLHWLIPNIRVRLVSKKMSKYYLQKGVVQDVIQTQQQRSSSGPKAILLMDNGQVIDKVPERHLETVLPKLTTNYGGNNNVIVLEGEHRWKKGRLLDRESSCGIVQLEEDLEVVKVPLDSVAEWCGRTLDTDG